MRYLFHFIVWAIILAIAAANDPKGIDNYGGFFGWVLAVLMMAGLSWAVFRLLGRVVRYLETGLW